jgi:hypothetical protein
MGKSKLDVMQQILTLQDQSKAYLFVGRFISEFANLEMMMDRVIINYFTVDPALSVQRQQEIISKNRSINSIMEHSILGSAYFSFQMKTEMIKAMMMERTPSIYTKHGNKIFNLINLLQKTRNLVAHYKTYVFNEEIIISKPKANFTIKKERAQKGGIIPEPTGRYETSYEQAIITEEIKNKISSQISYILTIIAHYSLSQNSGVIPKSATPEIIEKTLTFEPIFTGGVYDIDIIK